MPGMSCVHILVGWGLTNSSFFVYLSTRIYRAIQSLINHLNKRKNVVKLSSIVSKLISKLK
jgi:hypothetical protein